MPKPVKTSKQSKQHDYAVGYGKTPIATRFRKGTPSANPRGRPRGSKTVATMLSEAAGERVTFLEKGRERTLSKLELSIVQLVNQAATGNSKAYRELLQRFEEMEEKGTARAERQVLADQDLQVIREAGRRMQLTKEQ